MRIVSDYTAAAARRLGKTPSGANAPTFYTFLNDAGRRLFTVHQWEWRTRGPVPVAAVANQDYLDLPGDFGKALEVWVPNLGTYTAIEVVSRGAMARLRANATISLAFGVLYICFDGNEPPNHTPTCPRALLYPTPTATGTPTVQLIYDRRWVNLSSLNDAQAVEIPEDFEEALELLTKSIAWESENDSPHNDAGRFAAELDRLKNEDGLRQPSEGRMRGGVNSRARMIAPGPNMGLATL